MESVQADVEPSVATDISYGRQIFRDVQEIIRETQDKSGALIRVLQQAQEAIGYLPESILRTISRDMEVPLSEIYGIISFYHYFSLVPKGKYVIQVCMGTSCYVKGGQRILDTLKKDYGLEPGGITSDNKFSLETVRCLGCCGLSPVVAVGDDIHRRVKPNHIKDILNSYE
ncbi:MAG: NAD(P)H-dependent oxidoreductase subunit E [Dehalococcoidales bacterium]|nr:NAD(P)H-dependent oxidoreductase subunit E [Dehalococcoidales bacterium]